MGRQSPFSAAVGNASAAVAAESAALGAVAPRADWPRPALAMMLAGLAVQVGCTSAITSATLREALRQTAASVSSRDDTATPKDDSGAVAEKPVAAPREEIPAEPVPSLEEAIDRAVARLASTGGVDDATRAVLVQTLQTTRPRDWPAVVDEFVAALEVGRAAADTLPVATSPARTVAASQGVEPGPVSPVGDPVGGTKAPPDGPAPLRFPASTTELVAPPPQPAAAPKPLPTTVRAARPIVRPMVTAVAMAMAQPPAARIELIEPAAAQPVIEQPTADPDPLSPAQEPAGDGPVVSNACFATRVRAWGVVDRFPRAAFSPGQEVLVYFELEHLLARQSAAGHTTGVDTAFRLVTDEGEQVQDWAFPPLVETCHAPRRDYFVRYFLTMPVGLPAGQYRLEFLVTDTLAGGSTEAALDLEIIAAE
ncbi:MAG: hypothetical protein EBR86_07375 [Planctomycetia bacterium]|nr:hypothetical protein [Planctomycetia bacterium]